ncbi:hypothetical protein [Massilia sp. CFBP9026]|uniref:hypothetical protein n=1 Tax=Massilia sp. CFBP9026 TaxID=3096536 RepID=UPI002A6ABEDC|nr:hypothetical protein [Massilia sp. CFBP9026]MDY0965425.1 hypothetical protein [Massilia sp. CFBP9026]
MKDVNTAGASAPDLLKPDEVQTSALAPVPQQDPAVGGSYVRNVGTGEITKLEPVREPKEQE